MSFYLPQVKNHLRWAQKLLCKLHNFYFTFWYLHRPLSSDVIVQNAHENRVTEAQLMCSLDFEKFVLVGFQSDDHVCVYFKVRFSSDQHRKLLFLTSCKCSDHNGLLINSPTCAGICGVTSLSFKGAMKAERLGLITSILTLNGLNFPASCDKGIKKEKGKKKQQPQPGVHQMNDELTKWEGEEGEGESGAI